MKKYYRKYKIHLIVFCVFLIVLTFSFLKIFSASHIPNFDEPVGGSQVASITEIDTESEKPRDMLLGKAQISYAGGTEGRNKNIELGITLINGTVVAPGAEFSYTKTLGEITEEAGFSKEKMFLNGEVTKGVGGGLCQISSTLFQTVLRAGLPVTERRNHSYSVSYYDVGLDATYADPGPDLKFVNNTGYPITIKGVAANHLVTLELYGVSDGRIASTSEAEIMDIVDFPPTRYVHVAVLPGEHECVNTPQIGYTARVIHDVFFPNGETKEQIFTSVYKPLQRVCYIVGN